MPNSSPHAAPSAARRPGSHAAAPAVLSPFVRIWLLQGLLTACLIAALLMSSLAHAEGSFRQFLDGLWPDAKAAGVSREVFDTAFKGMEPDLTLPDLTLPGRDKADSSKGQAEFTRPPSEYLDKAYLGRLAAGRSRDAQEV